METKSYKICRENDCSVLKEIDNSFYMIKDNLSNSNIFLTYIEDNIAILHNNKKIFTLVKTKNENGKCSIQDLDTNFYFYSKPLFSESKRLFIANRTTARQYEFFDLKECETTNNHDIETIKSAANLFYKRDQVIDLFWWKRDDYINFGDELNLYIVEYLTKKKINRVAPIQSELVGIGSILNLFPKRKLIYPVWGTGTLYPQNIENEIIYSPTLLRGPLTNSLFKRNLNVPYGDPGILSSIIWKESGEKKYDWGLVVHHSQEKEAWVQKIIKNTKNSILISVKNENMEQLMLQFSNCKNIASTSLHGLVVADSYKIPNIWLWDNNLHKGGQWKFFDYFSGIQRTNIENLNPNNIESLSGINLNVNSYKYQNDVEKIQNRIIKSFPL